MIGTLNYASPADNANRTIFGLASHFLAGTVAVLPTLMMLAGRLIERELCRPGMHLGLFTLTTLLVAAPTIATLLLSTIGLALAAAGFRKNNRKQWIAPLGIIFNLAGLLAGILSTL